MVFLRRPTETVRFYVPGKPKPGPEFDYALTVWHNLATCKSLALVCGRDFQCAGLGFTVQASAVPCGQYRVDVYPQASATNTDPAAAGPFYYATLFDVRHD